MDLVEEIKETIQEAISVEPSEEIKTSDEYHYIGVVFGNTKVLTEKGEPTFDLAKTHYTYKTKEDYKKGQLITVPTAYGVSKAMVADESIDPSTIKYPLENIKEI